MSYSISHWFNLKCRVTSVKRMFWFAGRTYNITLTAIDKDHADFWLVCESRFYIHDTINLPVESAKEIATKRSLEFFNLT